MSRPLFWHHGLFLQPQHFQLEDRYLSSLVQPLFTFLSPHLWGVRSMEIQKSSLATGVFHLAGGEFMFRDMTHAVVPDNAVVEARSFEDDWVEGGKPLGVFLGLKQWDSSGGNVTVLSNAQPLSGITTRFVAPQDFEEVRDLHQDGPAAQVKRLKMALKILWETERDRFGDYEVIPIAQLERSGEDIVLSERFIPACTSLSASPLLEHIVREIRDQIVSRGHQLELYKRDRGIHTSEFGARDMVYLLALRSLNRYIPQLVHLSEEGDVHPWAVYGILRQLIGELSTFSHEITVTGGAGGEEQGLSPYLHQDLWSCFSTAQGIITRLLDEITAGPEYVFALTYDGTYFSSELAPAIFEGKNRFFLVFESQQDPKELLGSLASSAKLSSRESLGILIARALPALKLTHLGVPPQELPRKANALYFQIDHHDQQWANVQKGKNIALFWDSAPEDLKVELMVVGRT
ncbi:MAG: type VI secretion system baseplate subunit TssK [Desulfomonilia bacterium]|nr:type VI secretion system baseplate subunit TssK [Desulfomonilia bacterium]